MSTELAENRVFAREFLITRDALRVLNILDFCGSFEHENNIVQSEFFFSITQVDLIDVFFHVDCEIF